MDSYQSWLNLLFLSSTFACYRTSRKKGTGHTHCNCKFNRFTLLPHDDWLWPPSTGSCGVPWTTLESWVGKGREQAGSEGWGEGIFRPLPLETCLESDTGAVPVLLPRFPADCRLTLGCYLYSKSTAELSWTLRADVPTEKTVGEICYPLCS